MKLIDVHSHVQFHYYDRDREEVMARALEELETIINVGADLESSEKAVASTKQWPIYASVGFHPEEAAKYTEAELKRIETLAADPKVVAIGEIGLDVPNKTSNSSLVIPTLIEGSQSEAAISANVVERDFSTSLEMTKNTVSSKQIELLQKQLEIAKKVDKPIIFHCRNAYEELFELIKNLDFPVKGLMHCWMGSIEDTKKFLSLDLGISFTGNVTYKKNDYIRETAKIVPDNKLFVETDCPFLPPQPIRGSRNEPKFVKMVAECVAEVRGVSLEKVIETTNRNSKELFNLN